MSLDGRGQRVVTGVEDEDCKQLRRLGLARVAADRVCRVRRFGPALAGPIDVRLAVIHLRLDRARNHIGVDESRLRMGVGRRGRARRVIDLQGNQRRSEEHTSELQSLMRISYAVFCLKKKKNKTHTSNNNKNNK